MNKNCLTLDAVQFITRVLFIVVNLKRTGRAQSELYTSKVCLIFT